MSLSSFSAKVFGAVAALCAAGVFTVLASVGSQASATTDGEEVPPPGVTCVDTEGHPWHG